MEDEGNRSLLNAAILLIGSIVLLCVLSLLTSCSNANAVRIRVKNETERTLTFTTGSGLFSRTITLEPSQEWDGWADPRFVGNQIVVKVR